MNHEDTKARRAPLLGPPSKGNDPGREIVDALFKVHKALGPGLLESIYERCLCRELEKRGVGFRSQVFLPIVYDGEIIDGGLRVDLIVHEFFLLELKAVESLQPLHTAQLLTYLKLTGLRVGFLVNFNVPLIRDGIRRVVL